MQESPVLAGLPIGFGFAAITPLHRTGHYTALSQDGILSKNTV